MIDATILQSPEQAAHAFRAILRSFSTPAVPVFIAAVDDAPLPLLPAAASALLTLADYQTPIWLSPDLNVDIVRKYLRFHTGAAIVANAMEAVFVLSNVSEVDTFTSQLNLGSHEYPDRSTTVILQVSGFARGHTVSVSGPGLKEPVQLSVEGVSRGMWQHMQKNSSYFPVGNDFMFASAKEIMALPRSQQIKMWEAA